MDKIKAIRETLNMLQDQLRELGIEKRPVPEVKRELEMRIEVMAAELLRNIRYNEHSLYFESEDYWRYAFASSIAEGDPQAPPEAIARKAKRICEELRPVPPRVRDA